MGNLVNLYSNPNRCQASIGNVSSDLYIRSRLCTERKAKPCLPMKVQLLNILFGKEEEKCMVSFPWILCAPSEGARAAAVAGIASPVGARAGTAAEHRAATGWSSRVVADPCSEGQDGGEAPVWDLRNYSSARARTMPLTLGCSSSWSRGARTHVPRISR